MAKSTCVISIANQKGGVGKSTTALNLRDALESLGHHTLLLDCDPQSNSTETMRADTEGGEDGIFTMYDVFYKGCTLKEAIQHTENGDIVPNEKKLSDKEHDFVDDNSDNVLILKNQIKELDEYEFIIIDTPPNTNFYTYSALAASDYVIIPVTSSSYSLTGFTMIVETINAVKESGMNPDLKILGAVLTKFDARFGADNEVKGALPFICKEHDIYCFKTFIRTSQKIVNAQNYKMNMSDFAKGDKAYRDYVLFVKEILRRLVK